MSEKVHRKIRQQVGYKPHSKPGKGTRSYRILPREKEVIRNILVEDVRTPTAVGIHHTGQRFCDGRRGLVRAMKKRHQELRHG